MVNENITKDKDFQKCILANIFKPDDNQIACLNDICQRMVLTSTKPSLSAQFHFVQNVPGSVQ